MFNYCYTYVAVWFGSIDKTKTAKETKLLG